MTRIYSSLIVCGLSASAALAGPIGVTGDPVMTGTDGTSSWSRTLPSAAWINPANGELRWGAGWPGASPASNAFTVKPLTPGQPMIYGNVDPVLGVSFSVTNNTAFTQSYVFSFTLPIAPAVTPASLTGGSTGITITDNNGDGVTAGDDVVADAFYTALLDGGDFIQLDLLDPALTQATPNGSTSTSGSFGTPIPSLPGPAVTTSIGLRYEFTLTPGDSAGITGNFIVEAVPEPGSLALLAIGGALLSRRRRA